MGISNEQLLAICEQEFIRGRNAHGNVRTEQKRALDQYFLRPNGREREGYSETQTTETRDAIEMMLPILMDMYLQPESPVVFKPRAANDMQQTLQETAMVNHVLNVQNNFPLLALRWFKDALLLKNGYVKVFWDEFVEDRIEKYKGLDIEEYQKTLAELDERDEVIKVKENIDPKTGELSFDCTIRVVNGDPQVRVVNLPSTRVVVAAEHNDVSLAGANYVCHFEVRTKSDLIVDGYSKDKVKGLPTATNEDMELSDNKYVADDDVSLASSVSGDVSRDLVMVYEHYIRADKNGDGKSELLRVVSAGGTGNGTVLDVEEVDFIPIIALTPFVVPHNHYGMSLADFTIPYQNVATHIQRQILDNLNLANNPMLYVNSNAVQNIESVAKARLGGIVMGKSAEMAIQAVSVPFVARQSYEVLTDIERRMTKATGLNEAATGLNAEALAQSTNLVGAMTLNQAQLRARMIASVMAETGVKELVLRVRELLMKYMTKQEMVEISGQFVPMEPRSWIRNRAASVRIGLGTVQKQERIAVLQSIMTTQEKVFAAQQSLDGPLLNHQNVYNTLSELAQLTGSRETDRYFTDPRAFLQAKAMQPEPEQPIETALELEAAKLVAKSQKDAADIELDRERLELDKRKQRVEEIKMGLVA